MAIRRGKEEEDFTVLPNGCIDDSKLSFKARGILHYLLSKPADWFVSMANLERMGTEGREAIRKGIKELTEAGYVVREKVHGENGRWRYDSVVYSRRRLTVNGKPSTVSRLLQSTEEQRTNLSSTDVEDSKDAATQHPASNDAKSTPSTEEQPGTKQLTPQQEMFGAVCEAVGWDHKTLSKNSQAKIATTVKALRDASYTPEDIYSFIENVWKSDWRWQKKKDLPTIVQLREEIGKIRSFTNGGVENHAGHESGDAGGDEESPEKQFEREEFKIRTEAINKRISNEEYERRAKELVVEYGLQDQYSYLF